MLKIGDFSRLSHVSVKTLHHYDEIGLLRPIQVDNFTGYRYYSVDQLSQLNRILALKDLGFSLEQIRAIRDEQISPEEFRGMLRLKQMQMQQYIEGEQSRLTRIETRLKQIEQKGNYPDYEVVLKQVAPQQIASARAVVPSADEMFETCQDLSKGIQTFLISGKIKPLGPWLSIYHNDEYTEHDIDVEMAIPIDQPLPAEPVQYSSAKATIRTLDGNGFMASVVHHGTYDTILQAYFTLLAWIDVNGYSIDGPCRQIYLRWPEGQVLPVTEIQFPVIGVPTKIIE